MNMLLTKQLKINILIIITTLVLICPVFEGYSQTSNSTEPLTSFMDCYRKNAANFLLANTLTPFTFDLTDPKIKKLIYTMCEFYFDKTGIWIDLSKDTDGMLPYTQEFWNKYPVEELPPDLLEFWKKGSYNNQE